MFVRVSRRCFSTSAIVSSPSASSTSSSPSSPVAASASSQPSTGICALECYFPARYVAQSKLEQHDQISAGKYRVGLGQENMAFVDAQREDSASMAMTAVQHLLEKYQISAQEIGRLEVGTETPIDKSKSIKSHVMQLFEGQHGHGHGKQHGGSSSTARDLEGVDTINACYGGTSALLNAMYWSEVQQKIQAKKQYAIVVATDVSVYDKPAARPTGGAGAVAMLVGPDAPLSLDLVHKASHHEHAYDFYKPDPMSPYPWVDGHLSNRLYVKALDSCFENWRQSFVERGEEPLSITKDLDYMLFHAPYNKLVQKSYARLVYQDLKNARVGGVDALFAAMHLQDPAVRQALLQMAEQGDSEDAKYDEKLMTEVTKALYKEKVAPGTLLPRQLGNSYTASLYMGLCSLIGQQGEHIQQGRPDQRIGMFSYGSGLAATLFLLRAQQRTRSGRFSLSQMQHNLNVQERLQQRVEVEPADYANIIAKNLELYHKNNWKSENDMSYMPQGAYYLQSVDDHWRRTYARKTTPATATFSAAATAAETKKH